MIKIKKKVISIAKECIAKLNGQGNMSIVASLHQMRCIENKMDEQVTNKKKAMTNAEKQKKYRERQKERGKQEMRGYLSPEAKVCYKLISEQTNWSDSVILSNAVRLAYAAYKKGQIGLLNSWLKNNEL
jgi:ABC-type multidrug transport system ATPase subunit